jgi:hypothetical protein
MPWSRRSGSAASFGDAVEGEAIVVYRIMSTGS